MFCPFCGTQLPEPSGASCPACRASLQTKPSQGSTRVVVQAPFSAPAASPSTRIVQGGGPPLSVGGGNKQTRVVSAGTPLGGAGVRAPRRCGVCGTPAQPNEVFCGRCGAKIADAVSPATAGKQTVIYGKKKAARLALRVRKIGDEDGFQISLKKGVNLVGRTSDPRLASDSYLSSQHARVTFGDEGFLLEDTESANGTFLRIREGARLQVGDSFIAGDRVFEVVEAREGKEGESDGQG